MLVSSCRYLMSNKNSLLKNARNMLRCNRRFRIYFLYLVDTLNRDFSLFLVRTTTTGAWMLDLINRAALTIKIRGEGSE